MQNFSELGWVELGYFMVEDKTTKQQQQQLIDFRGYPSPQLELELSWQVGAKVDQKCALGGRTKFFQQFWTFLGIAPKSRNK